MNIQARDIILVIILAVGFLAANWHAHGAKVEPSYWLIGQWPDREEHVCTYSLEECKTAVRAIQQRIRPDDADMPVSGFIKDFQGATLMCLLAQPPCLSQDEMCIKGFNC